MKTPIFFLTLLSGLAMAKGITFMGPVIPGRAVNVEVTVSAAGFLSGWVDWNHNETWEPTERILACAPVTAGTNVLPVMVPAGALPGFTQARFRRGALCIASPTGPPAGGEVQDCRVYVRSSHSLSGLRIEHDDRRVRVLWDTPEAVLEGAERVGANWRSLAGASSPYLPEPASPYRFFRLRVPRHVFHFESMIDEAELIFEGVVQSVEYRNSFIDLEHPKSLPYTFATLQVMHILKGRVDGDTLSLRFVGGVSGDRFLQTSQSTLFDVGERSILFVRGNGKMGLPLVNCPEGRFRVIDDQIVTEDGRDILWTQEGQVAFGRSRPHEEVVENQIGNRSIRRMRSSRESEADSTPAPSSGLAMTKTMFAGFISELVAAAYSAEELAASPITPTAEPHAAFSSPKPAPASPSVVPVKPGIGPVLGLAEYMRWVLNGYNPVLP